MTTRLPALFISHGAPTFAIEPGKAGPLLNQLGRELPKPQAVVVFSPHWMTRGVKVTASARPETIHDFGGFPAALYSIQYPAPGSPDLAARIVALLQAGGWTASVDSARGLDHGAWVPVRHLYPEADVPVLQVSMPHDLDPAGAVRLGRALAPLADEGVLLLGSGSITHNLYEFGAQLSEKDAAYADEFVGWARDAVKRGDEAALVNYLDAAPHARRAHPSSDHYLPLPFAFGAAGDPHPDVQVLDGGMTYQVIGMEGYVFGSRR